MRKVVLERSYGSVRLHLVVPLSELPFIPPPQWNRNIPNGEIKRYGVEPVWLTARGRIDAELCLRLQGVDDTYDYITSATVHGRWKKRLHQGIIYAVRGKSISLASYANPRKPIPSRAERDALFEHLLEILESNADLPAEKLFVLLKEEAKRYGREVMWG